MTIIMVNKAENPSKAQGNEPVDEQPTSQFEIEDEDYLINERMSSYNNIIFTNFLSPLRKLYCSRESFTSLEIILNLKRFLINGNFEYPTREFRKTLSTITGEGMERFLDIIERLFLYIRDERRNELVYLYGSSNTDVLDYLIQAIHDTNKYITHFIHLYFDYCEHHNLILSRYLEINNHGVYLDSLARFIVSRYCQNYVNILTKGRNKNLSIRQRYCRDNIRYSSLGMIPSISWKKSSLNKRITKDTTIQTLLTESTEICCPICLTIKISEHNFSIVDSCRHLLCAECAGNAFFQEDDTLR